MSGFVVSFFTDIIVYNNANINLTANICNNIMNVIAE